MAAQQFMVCTANRAGTTDTPAKLFAAFVQMAEESVLCRLLMEIVVLVGAEGVNDAGLVLREAAEVYKVDVSKIKARVKQEFAAKKRTRANRPASTKSPTKAAKKRKAA